MLKRFAVTFPARGQENSRQPESGVPEQPRAPEPRPEQTDINISAEDTNTQIVSILSISIVRLYLLTDSNVFVF